MIASTSFLQFNDDQMTRLAKAMFIFSLLLIPITVIVSTPANADPSPAGVLFDSFSTECIGRLENLAEFDSARHTRVAPALEKKVLDFLGGNSEGTLWETSSEYVMLADFDSTRMCQIMGFNIEESELLKAYEYWRTTSGKVFTEGNSLQSEPYRGRRYAYLVLQTDNGEFLQLHMNYNKDMAGVSGFTSFVATRVFESSMALETLGSANSNNN